MKRVLIFVFSISILNFSIGRADEGMWMLPFLEQLNMASMHELGCALSADQIYSFNHSSIKDAIVIFGGGCTGEIVSDQGLLFTNHHCGFDEIQNHSTLEHDYLKNGFWAKTHAEELPNPDLEVKFVVKIQDVSDSIVKHLNQKMTESERRDKVNEISKNIEDAASDSGKFKADVKPFFSGNKYYLFVYKVYKDVRLVGAPPSSIGKFGYDTDNWEWPRHTGDFSIFRVYTAPDGSPAEYSPKNIPLKPKYYLPISLKGLKTGDFSMVIGYPGSTDRYLCSAGIKELYDIINPDRVKIRGIRQKIMMADMNANPKVNIQYAEKYSRSSNYWKYSIGENEGIAKQDLISRREKQEARFQKWADADSARKSVYGDLIPGMDEIFSERRSDENNFQYLYEALFRGVEIIHFVNKFNDLHYLLTLGDSVQNDVNEEIASLRKSADKFFKNYNVSTDIKITKAMFRVYYDNIPAEERPSFFNVIDSDYKGNIDKYVNKMFAKTIFTSPEKVKKFLDKPTLKVFKKDMAFQTEYSAAVKYTNEYFTLDDYKVRLKGLQRTYMKGLMAMDPDSTFYPDANFTIRLTYGTVEGYSPRDAVIYKDYTTLKGVMEKEDTTNFEFLVPPKLKELYKKKDFGPYGAGNYMPVCFITNNDITGGNSGSPVLNGKGELVGLAFDGNWEAMSSDIAYEPALQRCICVDIRYVLFVIDKFAGATNLIKELKIMN